VSRRLVDRVGLLSLGNGAALVLQLALGIFLARFWSQDAFGSFLQVTMLVATLSPILFLGIPSSLYYFLPRCTGPRRDRVLVQSLVLLAALGAAGAAAVALSAGPLAAALNNDGLAPAIRRYAFVLLGSLPAAVAHPLCIALHRYATATLVVSGVAAADAGLTAAAVLAGASLETLVLALACLHVAVGAGVAVAVARLVGREGLRAAWPPDRAALAEQFRYAVPFAASTHVGTLGRFLDRYVIGALFSPAVFAVYAVGAREVPVVPLIISSINIVLQQRFIELQQTGRAADMLATWQTAMRKQALLVIPLAVLLFLLADPFVTLLYSDRYHASVPVFRVYLALLVLRVATWGAVLNALGQTRTLLAGALLAFGTTAAVCLALVRPLGLLGPAVGAVVGPLAAAAFYLHRTGRVLGVPCRRVVPWAALGRVAAAAAAAALPVAPLAARLDDPVAALPLAAAYAGFFTMLAAATGALRAEDLSFLRGWLGLSGSPGVGRWWPARCGQRRRP
jgi:O-antigen/teichoic acid export membrane protein